jgi:hypothetical protein
MAFLPSCGLSLHDLTVQKVCTCLTIPLQELTERSNQLQLLNFANQQKQIVSRLQHTYIYQEHSQPCLSGHRIQTRSSSTSTMCFPSANRTHGPNVQVRYCLIFVLSKCMDFKQMFICAHFSHLSYHIKSNLASILCTVQYTYISAQTHDACLKHC